MSELIRRIQEENSSQLPFEEYMIKAVLNAAPRRKSEKSREKVEAELKNWLEQNGYAEQNGNQVGQLNSEFWGVKNVDLKNHFYIAISPQDTNYTSNLVVAVAGLPLEDAVVLLGQERETATAYIEVKYNDRPNGILHVNRNRICVISKKNVK